MGWVHYIIGDWIGRASEASDQEKKFRADGVVHLDGALDKNDQGQSPQLRKEIGEAFASTQGNSGARQAFADELSRLSPKQFKQILAETNQDINNEKPTDLGFFTRKGITAPLCFEAKKHQTFGAACFEVKEWNSETEANKLTKLQTAIDSATSPANRSSAIRSMNDLLRTYDARQLSKLSTMDKGK